jgi:hypothetical protein
MIKPPFREEMFISPNTLSKLWVKFYEDTMVAVNSLDAAGILALLLTVDGAGSGLDADLLDGEEGVYYGTAADVLANAAAILVNAGKIATNISNIATNAADIVTLYTRASRAKQYFYGGF